MELIYLLLIYSLIGGSCMYLLMCVDSNDKGVLGKLNRFVFDYMPKTLKNYGTRYLGERFIRGIEGGINWICWTNHPLVQLFYLVIIIGGFILYFLYGFIHLPNIYVGRIHCYVGSFAAAFCLFAYFKACITPPGEITKQNVDYYVKKYKYDGVLFRASTCTTCKLKKPARSKHCRVCNICVARFDHHCVWIRQCVGEKNYKYFLLFIFSHSILCIYGTIIGAFSIMAIVHQDRLMDTTYRIPGTSEVFQPGFMIVARYVFFTYTPFIFIIILCSVMGITLLIFFLYHCSMIKGGMSTNERIKRSDIMAAILKQIPKLEAEKQEIMVTEASKLPEEDKRVKIKDIDEKIKLFKSDYDTLAGMVSNGFWENLRLIARS